MRILISSHKFYPHIGGIEKTSLILAEEFIKQGHGVKLVTQSAYAGTKSFPFEVIRNPNPLKLLKLVRWCDVYFHNNPSLRTGWPLLITHKPWIITFQTWLTRIDGKLGWQDYLKCFVIKFATCLSVSKAIEDHLSTPSIIIGNPYNDDIFYEIQGASRDKELVFLGRLVSDKGVDILLKALGNIKQQGYKPKLTIIGDGPERGFLPKLAEDFGIVEQVNFVGVKTGEELNRLLSIHKIMVIPSRWEEPFGIIALEGIASGCVIVGSEGGGLKEAIGPCGITFPNDDEGALDRILMKLLSNPDKLAFYRKGAQEHLLRYRKERIARAYLKVFEKALK